jgi:hypothetical protein
MVDTEGLWTVARGAWRSQLTAADRIRNQSTSTTRTANLGIPEIRNREETS